MMHSSSQQPGDTPLVASTPERPASVPAKLLEDRVQRLEDAVALLTHHVQWENIEDRSNDFPSPLAGEGSGVRGTLQSPDTLPHSPGVADPSLPRAMPIAPPPTASLAEFTLPPFAEPAPPRVSPLTSVLRPLQSAMPLAHSMVNKVLPPSSLWRDLWWDLRTCWRMIRDPYYPMSTACKVFPLFALFYVTIWPLLSAWSGIIGTFMNYCVNAVVIYIAFKVIQRELRRYYEFAERYRR